MQDSFLVRFMKGQTTPEENLARIDEQWNEGEYHTRQFSGATHELSMYEDGLTEQEIHDAIEYAEANDYGDVVEYLDALLQQRGGSKNKRRRRRSSTTRKRKSTRRSLTRRKYY